MSKYPSDINQWTAQNLVDYFTEAGVFTNKDWVWVQDHENYWANLPIYEASGYMDNEGLVAIMFFTFKNDLPDVPAGDVEKFVKGIKSASNHMFPEYGELTVMPVDHMIGNVALTYAYTTDEAVYNAMDKAYNELVKALGVTPDF